MAEPSLTISLPNYTGSTAVTLLSLADIFGNTPSGFTPNSPLALTGGTWQITVIDAPSVQYNFTYSVTTGSGVLTPLNGQTSQTAGYQGRYINATLLSEYMGSINAQVQSDTNSTGQADAVAIQQAIMAAEDRCDSTLASNAFGQNVSYVIPLSFGVNRIDAELQENLCMLAAYNLYAKRVLSVATKKLPNFAQIRKDALNYLKGLWYGQPMLVNAAQNIIDSAPHGGRQVVDPVGRPIGPNGSPMWPWGWSFGYSWWWGGACAA